VNLNVTGPRGMPLALPCMRRLALSGLTPLFTGGPTLAHNLSRNRCPSPFR
jgi:hypothetical protein